MRRLLALAALACLLPVSALARPDKDGGKDKVSPEPEPKLTPAQLKAKDIKAMDGTFTVEKYVREGKAMPAVNMKVVQAGGEWRFFFGDNISLGRDTIDPTKTPREVDSTYVNGPARDKTAKGIYKIDGDTITYCHADPGRERPKAFDPGKDGSGLTLIVLKRQKEK